MRVLFVTGEYPAMQGGVGDYTRRLSQALCRLGLDVHVLTHVDAGTGPLYTPRDPFEPVVHPVLTHTGWGLWGQVQRLVQQVQPDVVQIQYQTAAFGLHPAINGLPWRLKLAKKRPTVVTTFHDLRVPYLFPKAGGLRWRSVLELARRSDAIVLTNPGDWDQLLDADPSLAGRAQAIPIGSNIRPQPPANYDRARQRAAWGAGPQDWLLAYFGFLNANKGGETLVRALSELVRAGRPARLLMIGGQVGSSDPTNRAYLAHVEGLIGELGLADRVSWTGFTSETEVSANLLAADCAVLPYREGASLRHGSLMAALVHGLPVVTTEIPAGRQAGQAVQRAFPQLRQGESVLKVPPEDPLGSAMAVTQIMTDAALRSHLAQGALNLSREFEWDTIAEKHLAIYQRGKL